MDSIDEPVCVKNLSTQECDKEAKDCKSSNTPGDKSDKFEKFVSSMSPQRSSTFVPVNGSLVQPIDNCKQKCNRIKENDSQADSLVNTNGGKQKQASKSVPNTKVQDVEYPSTSRGELSTHDKVSEISQEKHGCQKHKVCSDKAGSSSSSINGPSTSGTSKSFENPESSGLRENRKRPSNIKLNKSNLDDDNSSDTGNDDYSLGSEDGCIYTYRGGEHLADLPSSFFSLDMGLPLDRHLPLLPNYPVPQQGVVTERAREQGSRASSPDMDFLEMDFDPGPSCELDTGDESTSDIDLEAANNVPEKNEPVIRGTSPEYLPGAILNSQPSVSSRLEQNDDELGYSNVPSSSKILEVSQSNVQEELTINQEYGPYIIHVNFRGEQLLVRRTMSCTNNTISNSHLINGDLVSPREVQNSEINIEQRPQPYHINQGESANLDPVNFSSALYHTTMAKRLMIEKTLSDVKSHDMSQEERGATCESNSRCVEPPRSMVWSEREACERQVTQIGTSACGATAVVNVFNALGVPVDIEKINSAVGTRQRANDAPLPRYLLSRSVAGCTAADLVTGIQRASDGLVTARFFSTYPERAFSLSLWLADWISLGAVPILTLNLQVGCDGEIPDAWHHQMVFGVSPSGVYLCNPVECVPEATLWPRLTSPSVLLVRTRDVLTRCTTETDLTPLMVVPDTRFHTLNVLGQVANLIREWRARNWLMRGGRTTHVRIPASYRAGVTVAALTGSEAHRRLVHAAPPPLLGTSKVTNERRTSPLPDA